LVIVLWSLMLLAEIVIGFWWWWRHGSLVEIVDGARVRLVPSALLHPVLWGWVGAMALVILMLAMIGQMRAFP
jgi:hypothetical protein